MRTVPSTAATLRVLSLTSVTVETPTACGASDAGKRTNSRSHRPEPWCRTWQLIAQTKQETQLHSGYVLTHLASALSAASARAQSVRYDTHPVSSCNMVVCTCKSQRFTSKLPASLVSTMMLHRHWTQSNVPPLHSPQRHTLISGWREVWEDGQAYDELNHRLKAIAQQKEAITLAQKVCLLTYQRPLSVCSCRCCMPASSDMGTMCRRLPQPLHCVVRRQCASNCLLPTILSMLSLPRPAPLKLSFSLLSSLPGMKFSRCVLRPLLSLVRPCCPLHICMLEIRIGGALSRFRNNDCK